MADYDNCPIPGTHRRLEEAHRLWHRTAEAYEDPDEFRTQLNALIQALRNVTFVLQKEQDAIRDFDAWYERWRDLMKEDGVLRWLVQARNVIVKQGDLETHSTATAGIQASWDTPQTRTFEVPPLVPTLAVAAKILAEQDISDDVRKQGVLMVERRWVADDLPQLELLDALAHAHGVLTLLVQNAHRQSGKQMDTPESSFHLPNVIPPRSKLDRLPCMVASESLRSVLVHLGTGKVARAGFDPVEPAPRDEILERYGTFGIPPPPGSVNPLEWAPTYMEHAKRILAIDKYHNQIVFLFGSKGPLASYEARPEDQQEKYLFMNEVADEVKRTGATGIVFIADAWFVPATVEIPDGKRPADMEEREEALQVTAAADDGSVRVLTTLYTRGADETIDFSETQDVAVEGGSVFLLPVMQAWGVTGYSEQEAAERLKQELARSEPPPLNG